MDARPYRSPRAQARPDIKVFAEIGMIEHLMRTTISKALPGGASFAQWEVLTHISRAGDGGTPAELAAALQLTKGAITNTLQRMEAQGLATLTPDAHDGRKKRIRITKAGHTAYAEMLRRVRPHLDQLRGGFTEAEFEAALPFLRALRVWLDGNREPERQ